MSFTLAKLSEYTSTTVAGDPTCEINCVDNLLNATSGAITFFSNPKLKQQLKKTRASAVILDEKFVDLCSTNVLISSNPYLVFAKIAILLNPLPKHTAGIHPTAVISDESKLGKNCYIGPYTVIDENCVIGKNTYIGSNCKIYKSCTLEEGCRLINNVTLCDKTSLGKRVTIHPGAVIGSDGFGLANDAGKWIKIPQLGRVLVGDDVEIGANTTVDRGSLGDTILEEGVKLDNQIHIAHNVKIGAHTAMAACVGIAGSTTVGKFCGIGGGAGISGHLEIADKVEIGGMTRVTRSIKKAGTYVSGTPVQPYKKWLRSSALFNKIDGLAERIKRLEKS